MKGLSLIFKVLILFLMVPNYLYAYDFVFGGICYNINGNNVSVTHADYQGDVVIPSQVTLNGKTYSVTSIERWAFNNCQKITSVTIPSSITSIGYEAFCDCYSLSSVHIADLEAWCNIKFDYSDSNPLNWAHHLFLNGVEIINLIIPNSVTTIRRWSFHGCRSLASVSIPNSVTSINRSAFEYCSGLTSINVESGNLKYDSRNNCNAIIDSNNQLILGCKNTIIPNSVTSIGSSAFENCSGLTSITIPNSVTSIGSRAFAYCNGLASVTIPNSVTSIDSYAFAYCNGLASVTIPNSVTSIGESAFNNTEWYNNQPNGLVYAGKIAYKFKGEMPANMSVNIKDGTFGITANAFSGCSGLTSVTIPNSVISIGEWAFSGCSGLTSITIPNSVTSIGVSAFSGCSGLTSASIPYSVTTIGSYAFAYCNGLSSITIPNSVTSIGNSAFYDTEWYNNQPNGLVYAGKIAYKFKGEMPANMSVNIEDGTLGITANAFSGCGGLTSVIIPNSVTSIGSSAFEDCINLTTIVSEIEKPFRIDDNVFYGIPLNAQLTVPKDTKAAYKTTEGWNLFSNIVEVEGTEPDHLGQIHINNIYYQVKESGEAEVASVDDGVKSITIPSSVSNNNTIYKVTAIAKDALENCEHLAAVIWEPEVQFDAKVNNPNFLLYVSDEKYTSRNVKNVVVNGIAESIELIDDANGNNFYCPRVFRANSIIYKHNYQMDTGIGDSRGWETIVLPFDVQKYMHATKGELEPFTTWSKSSSKKPFWLFELTASGYKDVADIKANTPYIISMPNNKQYEQQYQIPGIVTFSASDVEVQKSDDLKPVSYQGRTFVPNYTNKSDDNYLPLNVSNNYVTNPSKEIAGSKFIRGLRAVHPFEAYMTTTDNTRSIDVIDGMTTAIRGILVVNEETGAIKVYDTRGILMKIATSMDDVRNGMKAGVYIVNGKKMVIK